MQYTRHYVTQAVLKLGENSGWFDKAGSLWESSAPCGRKACPARGPAMLVTGPMTTTGWDRAVTKACLPCWKFPRSCGCQCLALQHTRVLGSEAGPVQQGTRVRTKPAHWSARFQEASALLWKQLCFPSRLSKVQGRWKREENLPVRESGTCCAWLSQDPESIWHANICLPAFTWQDTGDTTWLWIPSKWTDPLS
jgi:hypothetical protein